MNKLPQFFAGALVVLALGVPLRAQTRAGVDRGEVERRGSAWVQEIDCRVPVEPGGTLTVRVASGTVRVTPVEDQEQMECEVRLAVYAGSREQAQRVLDDYQLIVRRVTGGSAYLGSKFSVPSAVYRIRVPLQFNLDLETQAGNLIVRDLQGDLRAASAAGEIRTGKVRGNVRVETAGGNLELGNIEGRLEARTAGGCVRVGDVEGNAVIESGGGHIITGRIRSDVRAQTAGGDIVLHGAGADVSVQTAGGQIRVGETRGSLRAQTAGGSIRLDAVQGPIRVETAGGSIDLYQVLSGVQASTAAGRILAKFAATAESFAPSALQTAVGDVEVYLPANLPLTIDATIDMAAGHKISSDFPLQIEGGQHRFHPSQVRGHGALNGGGAVLRIRTVSGDIKILKLDQASLERLRRQQESQWQRWRELHLEQLERERQREQERQQER